MKPNMARLDDYLYYHALAVHARGDTAALRKYLRAARGKPEELIRASCGPWEAAYRRISSTVTSAKTYSPHSPALPSALPDPAAEWEKLARIGARLIPASDASFPAPLRNIPGAPFGIYLLGAPWPAETAACGGGEASGRGAPDGAGSPPAAIAVVGTRRATPEGKAAARRFARELARAGSIIVSGLAFGIDAAAHEGALEGAGAGGRCTTVAVLAGGLDSVYPREHAKLAERIIASGGALISEYPPGSPPYPDRFLERNRLVSGLSRGVLIVEAPAGSGALATARFAAEQGRDVFAVPGPITHPNYEGPHGLIRQGAELVTKPEDILEAYGAAPEARTVRVMETLPPGERKVFGALAAHGAPADVDKIASLAKLEPQIVNRALSFLIAKEIVRETEGGYTI